MAKQRLDLTTSTINLTKALIDFPLTGTLADAGQETYKWLIRERINEASFNACRDLAASLAYPNEEGMRLQKDIDTKDLQILKQLKKAPLRLVVSGSLGRLVGRNPETSYIVTTVSALTRYHEPEFVTEALCSMILDSGGHEKEVSLRYDIHRAPIKAVVSKIVDSVYVNVVNAGQTLPGLPKELNHLHKHLLDDKTFAGIVMGVQKTNGDVIVRSERFLADLTLWLYFHFEGSLEVIVENSILLKSKRGAMDRVVRIMVDNNCPEGLTTCWDRDGNVEASIASGEKFFTFLRGSSDNDLRPCSFVRQPFYHLDDLVAGPRMTKSVTLKRAELNSITHAAKMVFKWMLEIPINPGHSLTGLCFKLNLLETDETRVMGELFPHHSQLLHLPTGAFSAPGPVFRLQDDYDGEDNEDLDQEFDWEVHEPTTAGKIVTWFPLLQDILEALQQRCSCHQCKVSANLDDCKSGCLREAGMTRFLLLLAHGFSDAVGGVDASGRSNPEDQVKAMTNLFHEIVQEQIIRWDTVFELAACTVAGTEWSAFDSSRGMDDGCSSWAAVQYGSFVAAATWLDLTSNPAILKPFALVILEGNIQGIPDDFGLVRCEMMEFERPETSEVSEAMEIDDNTPLTAILSLTKELDTVNADIFTAIFRSDTYLYRIMTTVQSGNYYRIIDPSMVARSCFSVRSPRCTHDDRQQENISTRQRAIVHDFDYALGHWSSQKSNGGLEMSKTLDSMVKLNTLLGISIDGCVLRDMDRCCLDCALGVLIPEGLRTKVHGFQRLISFHHVDLSLVKAKRREDRMQ